MSHPSVNPDLVPVCNGCGKKPEELMCYVAMIYDPERPSFDMNDLSPVQIQQVREYVLQEEGTLNPVNHHFLCDGCYIDAGMPTGEGGRRWVAP